MGDELNFIEALKIIFKNLFNKLAPRTFSVAISAWNASSDADYSFAAEISASGVTAADSADVRFDKASIKLAGAAGVITGETAADKIILLAEKKPTAALSGVYVISKGRLSNGCS